MIIIRYDHGNDWSHIYKDDELIWRGHYSDLLPDELIAILQQYDAKLSDIGAIVHDVNIK